MIDQQNPKLIETVRGLADKARRLREQYGACGLGEEDTKAALISPMLEALGWNVRDPDEVRHEYRHTTKDTPVDYCLQLMRTPKLLVEAKRLGEDLSDHKWIKQTLGYATMAGAGWCVLTDGDEYRLYNAATAVEAEQRLFRKVRLSDGTPEDCAKVLGLISRNNMGGPLLDDLWWKHRTDCRVTEVFRELVNPPDKKLVLLIRKRTTGLSPKEIAASIRRLGIRIEAPELPYEPGAATKPPDNERGRTQGQGVSLADVIRAGVLAPPVKLFRVYKGKRLEATLLPDGRVEFQGQRYGTCSAAAEAARKSVTGQRMNTNGWSFWQYQGTGGKTLTLADARQQVARAGGKFVGGQEEGKAVLKGLQTRGEKGRGDGARRYDLRKKFWEGLLGRPGVKGTRHADLTPAECGWIAAGSGVRGLPFVYVVRKETARVELWIDRGAGKAAENKDIFDWLAKRKGEIERAFGGELWWDHVEGRQSCRVAYVLTAGGYKSDESKWPGIQDAMIDAMRRLETALGPHLAKMKTELLSEGV